MTFSCFRLLYKLKSAQRYPDDTVLVSTFPGYAETANTNLGERKTVYLNSSFWEKRLSSCIERLKAENYIEQLFDTVNGTEYRITSKGCFFVQDTAAHLMNGLVSSVILPCIVAYITAKYFS